MWLEAMAIPQFKNYMPDEWIEQNGKNACRTYFYQILGSLAEEYLKAVIRDVKYLRRKRKKAKEVKPTKIHISDFWLKQLGSLNYQSCKLRICFLTNDILPAAARNRNPNLLIELKVKKKKPKKKVEKLVSRVKVGDYFPPGDGEA